MISRTAANRHVIAWQCIGCGKIEAPQPCIGVCQDRKVEFVHAAEFDEVVAQLATARAAGEAMIALVRQLAYTTPHEHQWERTCRAMQSRALDLLAALSAGESRVPA